MQAEVLLSCMNQRNFEIVQKSNIDFPVLVINQCDEDGAVEINDTTRMIKTRERGLSKSRNMAIKNAKGDICIIADDDEVFEDYVDKKIIAAYQRYKSADIIIFKMNNYPTKLGNHAKKLRKLDMLRVSSWQITFRLNSVKDKISFDCNLGAGTRNGAGEENKFLLDCMNHGLNVIYVPMEIASVAQTQSTWFTGFKEEYFFKRGRVIKYILGQPLAMLYCLYFVVTKRELYRENLSTGKAFWYMLQGMRHKLGEA